MQLEPEEDKPYNFRFSGGGHPCQYCHSRTGWSWIRNHGKEYGVCFACGTSKYPGRSETTADPDKGPEVNGQHPFRYIPLQVVEQTMTAYRANPFVQFLKRTAGAAVTEKIIRHFRIGTARNGGTVFWYFDKDGFCRKPKVVFYASDGHRIKNDPRRKPHCAGYITAKGYRLTLFGEQQLNPGLYPGNTPVVLVESEKTVCVGYAFLPEYIWLATGGAGSLNPARAAALAGRQVIILPDADPAGREGAEKCLRLLERLAIEAQVRDLFSYSEDHTDLADYLLSQLRENSLHAASGGFAAKALPLARPFPQAEREKMERIFSKHPLLWQLSTQLGLEIIAMKDIQKSTINCQTSIKVL